MISAEVAQGTMVYHWTLTLSVYIQVPYHSVIHINQFKSALTTSSFFFLIGAILIGPSSKTLEHWALPNRSNSLDPNHKIETNVHPIAHCSS
jgi:hypothetical protein